MAEKATVKETKAENRIPYYIPISVEHQDDVIVTINGYKTQIQRGKNVEVTPQVYEVLENMRKMDEIALQRSIELQGAIKGMN